MIILLILFLKIPLSILCIFYAIPGCTCRFEVSRILNTQIAKKSTDDICTEI